MLIALIIGMVSSLSGCVYVYNKGLDDLSYEEKQQVLETLEEVRDTLKEVSSDDTADFVSEIMDEKIQAISESLEK